MSWQIDLDFPGANGCGAAVAAMPDGGAAVSLTPDPREGNEALWFRFRLWRLDAEAPPPALRLRNMDTLLGAGDGSALQPVVRCDGGPWERLPRGEPEAHADGRCDARWRLPAAGALIEVAFCYPYGPEELAARMGRARGLRLQTIGASERGRPLWRVDNGPGAIGSARPGLFVVARQHSGETPGSWVLDGLLERVAELGDRAPLTWAIPFADLDGVVEGRYGKDRHPVDFNRSWPGDARVAYRHETLCYLRDFHRWRERCAPRLVLDLHAPGGHERTGCYAFLSRDAEGQTQPDSAAWAERLRGSLGVDAAPPERFVRFADYPSRWPRQTYNTFSRWADLTLRLPALSLETTYQGNGDRTFTLEEYREIGRRIADAVAKGLPAAAGAAAGEGEGAP